MWGVHRLFGEMDKLNNLFTVMAISNAPSPLTSEKSNLLHRKQKKWKLFKNILHSIRHGFIENVMFININKRLSC